MENEYEFTNKEEEIYKMLIKGLSNKEIAKEFRLSVTTINFHVRNIMDKQGIHDRKKIIANEK